LAVHGDEMKATRWRGRRNVVVWSGELHTPPAKLLHLIWS
jgi:hypothetical protein